MPDTITRNQLEQLYDAKVFDKGGYHKLLEEYTGIVAKPYTAYSYYDCAGNYLGGSDYSDIEDLLENAYIKVALQAQPPQEG